MTISGLLFAIYGWYNVWISHNLFYSLDLGIIIGFAISNDLDRKLYNIIDYSSNNKLNN